MKGEAGLLTRIDVMFGIELFTKMYRDGGKVVFGSWPSLHAGWPFLFAGFKPRSRVGWVRWGLWGYCAWVWWAALYLEHHYLVDVLGGVAFVVVAKGLAKWWVGGSLEEEGGVGYLPVVEGEDE